MALPALEQLVSVRYLPEQSLGAAGACSGTMQRNSLFSRCNFEFVKRMSRVNINFQP